jgi:hypothetical protein
MDVQSARELQNSVLWTGLVEELDRLIAFNVQKLKTCSPEDLKFIQYEIGVYESLKNIPQFVIDREEGS